jgi:uncharacterized membrane protein
MTAGEGPLAVPAVVGFQQVAQVVEQRCVLCHGEALQSKGIRLDSNSAIAERSKLKQEQVGLRVGLAF